MSGRPSRWLARLVLLDQLLTVKELEQVYCCNELNCAYSAEGYARACGAAAAEGEAAN
jgi:pyruvate decarboxylase